MPNHKASRDSSLIGECVAGSESAWTEFYHRYIGLVRNVVKRKGVWNPPDVDDMCQTVFAELIPALKNYDSAYSLARFVSTIAERACIQEYRRSVTAKRYHERDPADENETGLNASISSSGIHSPEDQLARTELLEGLRRGLRGLDSPCRQLLTMRFFEDLSYKEIAGILGATENTLSVRLKRCLQALRTNCRDFSEKGGRR